MTTDQAYSVLGLRPGASRIEIQQTYIVLLRALQLQLVPGMPLANRRKAQDQILELGTAFELLKNTATTPPQPTPAHRCSPPKVKPPGQYARQPRAASSPGPKPVFTIHCLLVAAGVVLVAIVGLLLVLFSVSSKAPETTNGTARLRVLSVPWSYVEVDGVSLGPSGQADAFTVQPGERQLVLRQGDRVFPVTISIQENCETIVQAQLEKRQIYVSYKKIQLTHD